jgi:hypothetical protein
MAKDSISKAEMAANYGWALSFLKSNKELWKLFNRAVDKNYNVNRFVAELRNTKWFKKHSDTYRQQAVLQKTDPATFKQNSAAMRNKIHDMATAAGADLTSKELDMISHNAQFFGWDEGMIKNSLANYIDQMGQSGHYGGDAGQAEGELRDYAYKMGLKLHDSPRLRAGSRTSSRATRPRRTTRRICKGRPRSRFPRSRTTSNPGRRFTISQARTCKACPTSSKCHRTASISSTRPSGRRYKRSSRTGRWAWIPSMISSASCGKIRGGFPRTTLDSR